MTDSMRPVSGGFIKNMGQLIVNQIETRTMFLRRWLNPKRDIEEECGHPYVVDLIEMKRAFLRGDIAKRVVCLYPEESWKTKPLIFETEDSDQTEFEKAWDELEQDMRLCSFFLRADILSGIGRFGIILLGIDDGLSLDKPIDAVVAASKQTEPDAGTVPPAAPTKRKLIYLRAFDETFIQIRQLDNDVNSPRFGQPLVYSIQFSADQMQGGISGTNPPGTVTTPNSPGATTTRDVHWSRVIHIADNRLNNDIYGLPRMEVCYNRILDIKKIAGGSGEMFWKGGFPGLSLETPATDDGQPVQFDKEATREEMEKYMNGLQRYIALIGLQAKSLNVEVADPSPHLLVQMQLIAISLSVPMRVFMGSEQSQLASGQDMIAWNDRMNRRREEYLTAFVILPFIERLQEIGILPQTAEDTGVSVEWDNLNAPTKSDRSTYSLNQTGALTKYLQAGGDQLVPPFHYLTLIMGLTDEEAQSCIDETQNLINTDPTAQHQQQIELIQTKADANAQAAAAAGLATPGASRTGRNGNPALNATHP